MRLIARLKRHHHRNFVHAELQPDAMVLDIQDVQAEACDRLR